MEYTYLEYKQDSKQSIEVGVQVLFFIQCGQPSLKYYQKSTQYVEKLAEQNEIRLGYTIDRP